MLRRPMMNSSVHLSPFSPSLGCSYAPAISPGPKSPTAPGLSQPENVCSQYNRLALLIAVEGV